MNSMHDSDHAHSPGDDRFLTALHAAHDVAVPTSGLDALALPGILSGEASTPRHTKPLFSRIPIKIMSPVAAVFIAILIVIASLSFQGGRPQPVSAQTLLRRAAAAAIPPNGKLITATYTISVSCGLSSTHCPTTRGHTWTVNVGGLTLSTGRIRVRVAVSKLRDLGLRRPVVFVGQETSMGVKRSQGVGSGPVIPGRTLREFKQRFGGRALEKAYSVEGREDVQNVISGYDDALSLYDAYDLMHHFQPRATHGAYTAPKLVSFDGGKAVEIRVIPNGPGIANNGLGAFYLDPTNYAMRGVTGRSCIAFAHPRSRGPCTDRILWSLILVRSAVVALCQGPLWPFSWYVNGQIPAQGQHRRLFARCSSRGQRSQH